MPATPTTAADREYCPGSTPAESHADGSADRVVATTDRGGLADATSGGGGKVAASGGGGKVAASGGATGRSVYTCRPFGVSLSGRDRWATGEVNRDGLDDRVVAPGNGPASRGVNREASRGASREASSVAPPDATPVCPVWPVWSVEPACPASTVWPPPGRGGPVALTAGSSADTRDDPLGTAARVNRFARVNRIDRMVRFPPTPLPPLGWSDPAEGWLDAGTGIISGVFVG